MTPAFARLPMFLLAVGTMSSCAVANEGAASGNRRFLAKAQSEGEQCGSSGSDGHFYGECSSGLECVAPAAGSPPGTPSTCQKALLPCQGAPVTNNCGNPSLKCFYDPTCSTSGGVGCNAGGVGQDCRFCDTGGGAPPCPITGQQEGQQCGSSGSDGHFYGDCSSGLACVPPADGDPVVGAPSICRKVCGSFGADGDHINGTCGEGQTCSGKAATPCREWAGECYMYCS